MNTVVSYEGKDVTFLDVDPVDYIAGEFLLKGKFYEQRNLEFVRSLNVTGTYVDVGAFIGTHSLYFSLFCPATHVYAFEANPRSYNKLIGNLAANGITNVYTFNAGLADKQGRAVLREANETNPGATWLSTVQHAPGNVSLFPLDFFNIPNVRLMKIDVEGMELRVLHGAVNTLKTVDHLFAELWSPEQSKDRGMDYQYPAVVKFLKTQGLEVQKEFDDRLYWFKRV